MSAFDELTLGEVDDIGRTCLDGKSFTEADPLKLAGAMMWAIERKSNPALDWDDFRYHTSMSAVKAFSERMNAEESGGATNPPVMASLNGPTFGTTGE